MKTLTKDISAEKSNGRFYTPDFIVSNILDMSGYYGNAILKKHAIDNSCGDGAFLIEIVKRYCEAALSFGFSSDEIASQLSDFIHGIEIDAVECEKCIANVTAAALKFGVKVSEWDIHCEDAMSVRRYDNKMDFVLGNPPYVRVHNAGGAIETIKTFSFAQNGMTDLYIAFYELGLNMLNENGVLGYITPSSYFNSIAGYVMRRYLIENNLIEKIIDLKHYQAFSAMTYTAITVLKKVKKNNIVSYYQYDENNHIPYYVDSLTPEDFYIKNNFYFSTRQNLQLLKRVFFNTGHCNLSVKNGFATLCDKVFIGKFSFKSEYIIPVVKASTGKTADIFYPYDKNARLIPETDLQKDKDLYQYLLDNKDRLLARSNENSEPEFWYAFGRSQAIIDTYKDKFSINALLRTSQDLKIVSAPSGTGVYSGLYIIGDQLNEEVIKNALFCDEFIIYISLLGKYKSGGYYTFSSKDLKAFLDYKLNYAEGIFAL